MSISYEVHYQVPSGTWYGYGDRFKTLEEATEAADTRRHKEILGTRVMKVEKEKVAEFPPVTDRNAPPIRLGALGVVTFKD